MSKRKRAEERRLTRAVEERIVSYLNLESNNENCRLLLITELLQFPNNTNKVFILRSTNRFVIRRWLSQVVTFEEFEERLITLISLQDISLTRILNKQVSAWLEHCPFKESGRELPAIFKSFATSFDAQTLLEIKAEWEAILARITANRKILIDSRSTDFVAAALGSYEEAEEAVSFELQEARKAAKKEKEELENLISVLHNEANKKRMILQEEEDEEVREDITLSLSGGSKEASIGAGSIVAAASIAAGAVTDLDIGAGTAVIRAKGGAGAGAGAGGRGTREIIIGLAAASGAEISIVRAAADVGETAVERRTSITEDYLPIGIYSVGRSYDEMGKELVRQGHLPHPYWPCVVS